MGLHPPALCAVAIPNGVSGFQINDNKYRNKIIINNNSDNDNKVIIIM
jgi:hypothetical protein